MEITSSVIFIGVYIICVALGTWILYNTIDKMLIDDEFCDAISKTYASIAQFVSCCIIGIGIVRIITLIFGANGSNGSDIETISLLFAFFYIVVCFVSMTIYCMHKDA